MGKPLKDEVIYSKGPKLVYKRKNGCHGKGKMYMYHSCNICLRINKAEFRWHGYDLQKSISKC